VIGHYSSKGWVIDKAVSKTIGAGDHVLGLTLAGTTVSVTLDGAAAVSHVYNAVTTDGKFGLFCNTASSFDTVTVTATDSAFRIQTSQVELAGADPSMAGGGSTLTTEALAPVIQEAIDRWSSLMNLSAAQLQLLNQTNFQIADFNGMVLGNALEASNTIILDSDAAGYGWFIDPTPADDAEFTAGGAAAGDMDLLSVVMHEMGHVLGFEHLTANAQLSGVMAEYPALGTRTSLTPETIANRQEVTYCFDEATGEFVTLDKRYTTEELEAQALAFYVKPEEETVGAAAGANDWVVEV
jgi:hypothetical protein